MRVPRRPPPFDPAVLLKAPREVLGTVLAVDAAGKYRHWDTFRRLAPPAGITPEQWWMGVKLSRRLLYKTLPLCDTNGDPFVLAMPDSAWEMVHRIDQRAAGEIAAGEVVTNPHERERYIVNSLMEEAITSSQLEGAVATRVVAKEMLRSGRPPRDRSEQMILNNYRGIRLVRELTTEELTPELVLRIHRVMTEDTLDNPDAAGRLQRPGERRVQVFDNENNVLHTPPPAEALPARVEAMCAFANDDGSGAAFIHPVVRAVLLHFWLAYDHPFEDGNGRTARALFYWAMLRRGYWLAEFLTISSILLKAPARYGRAFLYTETDDNDTTYFVLYQLSVVCRAIDELHAYLDRKIADVRRLEALLRRSDRFNYRQVALLSHALRHPDARYTFTGHARSHNVTRESARLDLQGLARCGMLERHKRGREFVFVPVPDLAEHLAA